ncbi:MAG: hypothetical protein IPP39_08910 [Chitinophagaceae bacterium]|nr:hypothetical protein [Chitinophagaceae bacterium]
MNKILFIILIFSISSVITLSCSKDKGGTTTVDFSTVINKAYAADVSPILQASCNLAGCHAAGSFNGPGALTNYTEIFNARAAIRVSVASGRMPQGSSLSTGQKNSILCWIDSGAPNN